MKFYELFIALRYMKSNLKQSLIIMIAISLGVSVIIWVPSVNLSFFNDLIDRSVSSAPHIKITKEINTFEKNLNVLNTKFDKELLLGDQTVTKKRYINSYKRVQEQISTIRDIEETSPLALGQAFVIRGGDIRGVNIEGIIPGKQLIITDIAKDMIRGRIDTLGIDNVVIGEELSKKINAGIGDRISVMGHTGINKNLKITGIFATGLRAKDEGQIYVNLKSGQQILALGQEVNAIGVKVKDIYSADDIAQKIETLTGLDSTSWKEDNKQILEQIGRFKIIIAFINFLIIFSAASSITSVFILLVSSKIKEIGILKSMGAKNNSVMVVFLFQAMSLSILGFMVGVIGAQFLLSGYAKMISSSSETVIGTRIPEIHMSLNYVLLAGFYSVVTSLLASLIPANQAAKIKPVEAINA